MSELTKDEQMQRYIRCVNNPFEFAKYAKVKDSTNNQIIPFELWDHQKVLLTHLSQGKHKRIIVLKPKQVGFSWGMGLWHLFLCHRLASNVLVISKGEDYAADLVDKSRFINNNMPSWLKLESPQARTTGTIMQFPSMGSRIKALPSTKDAGVGETATHVTRDEVEFHEYAEENFGHISPTIDAGATIVDGSTSSRSNPQSHFKTIYRKAKRGENSYLPLFWNFMVRPDRTWKWYYETKRNYNLEWMFQEDYPVSEDDSLGAVTGLGLFDREAVNRLLENVRPPIETSGPANIYRLPDPKQKYYCGADIAEGRGGDYSVVWIDTAIGADRELVAIMRSNQLTPPLFAFHANELLKQYGRPQIVCGADAWGLMFLQALKDLGYFNIYSTKLDKLGYIEGEVNKQENFMNFALAVKNGMKIPYKEAIEEMQGWNVNTRGNYESTGAFDDCIQAAAKATFSYRKSSKSSGKPEFVRVY